MTHQTTTSTALGDAHLAAYRRKGSCIVRGLFTADEIADMTAFDLADLKRMATDDPERRHLLQIRDLPDGTFTIQKIEKVSSVAPVLGEYGRDPRLLTAASTLMGEPAHLFKDKYIVKPRDGGGFGCHQDMTMGFHRFISGCISAMVALDPADEENGCLELASIEHTPALISRPECALPGDLIPESAWEKVPLAPGDVAFFDGLTPHRSAPNHSDRLRRVFITTYAPARDGDQYEHYYQWLFEWMQHIAEGGQRIDFGGTPWRRSRPDIRHFADLQTAAPSAY